MPNYRRLYRSGGTYFFTLVTYRRRKILCDEDLRIALRHAIRTVKDDRPFHIDAWVFMPDHLHCIWTLPNGDADFSSRWACIKRLVTKCCGQRYHQSRFETNSKKHRHEGTLWQRRFWEHNIRDEVDLNRCRDYLHWNPVKHDLVSRVSDWPYSTFHRFVREGGYPMDWGGGNVKDLGDGAFGE